MNEYYANQIRGILVYSHNNNSYEFIFRDSLQVSYLRSISVFDYIRYIYFKSLMLIQYLIFNLSDNEQNHLR